MLKIRLMRIGAKKRPFYRIIVADQRNKRNGAYLDLVGTYNPLTEPKEIKIDQPKLDDWIKKGAQKSDGLLRILKEAPQKHRKPKKEQPAEAPTAPKAQSSEEKESASETPAEEKAVETETPESPAEVQTEEPAQQESEQKPEEQPSEAPVENKTEENK